MHRGIVCLAINDISNYDVKMYVLLGYVELGLCLIWYDNKNTTI